MVAGRGAATTARTAIATGDAAWLRAHHADGMLDNGHGLVSHAVAADQPGILALLLDLGLDPDESGRVDGLEEVVPTWGEPLRACAISAKVTMAEILLAHGGNPNTNVYAASSAMYEAYKRRSEPMMALLERHGGRLTAVDVAELGLVENAAKLLAEDAERGTPDGSAGPGSSVVAGPPVGRHRVSLARDRHAGAPGKRLAGGRSTMARHSGKRTVPAFRERSSPSHRRISSCPGPMRCECPKQTGNDAGP